jgi:hypothetical protein
MYDQVLLSTHKTAEHYDSSGTLYFKATDALTGDRFLVEQGDNGFRFKETETGKYLALKGQYVLRSHLILFPRVVLMVQADSDLTCWV